MKRKIVGILVVTLLIATAVLPVVGTINVGKTKMMETPVDSDCATSETMKKGGSVPHIGPFCWLPDCDWNYWDDSDILYTHELTDNVGIGTANPNAKLEVKDDDGILVTASNGDMRLCITPGGITSCPTMVETGHVTISPYGGGAIYLNAHIVYFEGGLHVNGAINLEPVTEPTKPDSGFLIYCDEADGKLKAKSTTGSVTILAPKD